MGAIITLTTDFGLADGYVAAMKGVILSINPEAKLVDLCHEIEPQNISQAAFILGTTHHFFPEGTIHVAVVDPGVGTGRRAVILRTPRADFVAPDNGVLSYILSQSSAQATGPGLQPVELPPGLEAVELTNPRFWRSPPSSTFHGRDIFAPVAAWLSLGHKLEDFGERITSLGALPIVRPRWTQDGVLVGCILHVDHFGNLITNIKGEDLPPGALTIEVAGERILGLSRTYGEGEGLLALIGSSGYLEIALKEGSASARLGARVGDEVKISAG